MAPELSLIKPVICILSGEWFMMTPILSMFDLFSYFFFFQNKPHVQLKISCDCCEILQSHTLFTWNIKSTVSTPTTGNAL